MTQREGGAMGVARSDTKGDEGPVAVRRPGGSPFGASSTQLAGCDFL